ncbi:MAG: TonB-dependent receptor [Myxococcota bacterium]
MISGRSILAHVAAILVLVSSAPAWAITTGQLRVVVVDDEMELPVPSVTLTLAGENLIGGVQERASDANGEALFTELPPGIYSLRATKSGFAGVTIEGIPIDLNRTRVQQIKLSAASTEELVVTAERKAVDVENTSTGSVLTKEFLERIPAGRTYQTAVQTVPGVQAGSGGNPNMAGGASNENTYMLDGANITDPVTGTFSLNFNFDAIQQIEVLLGAYMPEYGTSTGGIINIVTQTGTNNLEFNSAVYYTNGNFAPKLDERLSSDGIEIAPTGFDSQFQLTQVSSTLSGPLIRDKAWFFLAYENARSVIANTGIPQARDYEGNYLLTKLIFQPNPEHRLSSLLQTNPTTIDNIDQFDPYYKPEAQGRQAQGGFVSVNKWQWFLSPDMNLDTTLTLQKTYIEQGPVPCTHNRSSDNHPCRPGEGEGDLDWETPGHVGLNGAYNSVNWGQYYFDDRFNYTASTKLSVLSVEDPFGGTHDLKFGLEGVQQIWDQIQGFSGNSLYIDINEVNFDPNSFQSFYWLEITGPIKFRTSASEYNVFAQDSWKPVSNLTVNYGSRFDTFVMRNDLGEPVLTGALLGPRLFAAWDPFKDQKTKIATGYGRFNDTGRLGIASFTSAASYGSKLYLGEYFLGAGDAGLTGFMNSQSYLYSVGPKENLNVAYENLRTPRIDELMLNAEREIVQDVALFTTMTGKFTRYLYTADDRNLSWDSDGSAVIGSRFADFLQTYPRMRTPALSKRDYFRWDMGVRKIESRRWAAQLNYSYTQSIGSTESALTGAFMIDPQTQYNYGRLATDIRHAAQGYAFWDLPTDPWTQQVSLLFLYSDGYPEERFYVGETPFPGYSIRVRPRGTYIRFNPWWYVSLRFAQDIDVRKGKFQVSVTAENVLNNLSPQFGNGGFIDSDNRNQTIFRQDPLQLQFGARYEF